LSGVGLQGSVVVATYKGYRYPVEVIGHAVWLYHRFALSLRDVEELMGARGVVVSHETASSSCLGMVVVQSVLGRFVRNLAAYRVFHAAAAAIISSQTAKRSAISWRHWGALIR
jgi:hypothetical protein